MNEPFQSQYDLILAIGKSADRSYQLRFQSQYDLILAFDSFLNANLDHLFQSQYDLILAHCNCFIQITASIISISI